MFGTTLFDAFSGMKDHLPSFTFLPSFLPSPSILPSFFPSFTFFPPPLPSFLHLHLPSFLHLPCFRHLPSFFFSFHFIFLPSFLPSPSVLPFFHASFLPSLRLLAPPSVLLIILASHSFLSCFSPFPHPSPIPSYWCVGEILLRGHPSNFSCFPYLVPTASPTVAPTGAPTSGTAISLLLGQMTTTLPFVPVPLGIRRRDGVERWGFGLSVGVKRE